MANILLPQQIIKIDDIEKQFPDHGFKTRKVIFQCELRKVEANGDCVFALIAYAAWRRNNNDRIPWNIGTTPARSEDLTGGGVLIHPVDNGNADPSKRHVAFGNNEISWPYHPRDLKGKDDEKDTYRDEKFYINLSKILSDKKLLATSNLNFTAKVSENPHVYYQVALDDGSSTQTANPCPPNQPGE